VTFEITRAGTYGAISNRVNYPDAEDHWSSDYVGFLGARNLTEAQPDGNFGVGSRVSRAMFAHMFAMLERADLGSYNTSSFDDISTGRWYFRAVEWAADMGIIQGTGNGRFEPDRLVTREEMATMLYRYITFKGWDTTVAATREITFTDYAEISDWATEAVTLIQQLGIIVGRPGGAFDPQGITTRAEYATIFARLIQAFSK
jgi:hypothetical protein